jgi:hypothetical protein
LTVQFFLSLLAADFCFYRVFFKRTFHYFYYPLCGVPAFASIASQRLRRPSNRGWDDGGREFDLRDFSYYDKVITDMKKFLNHLLTVILLGARILNSLSAMNDELAKVDLTDSQKK